MLREEKKSKRKRKDQIVGRKHQYGFTRAG
jgi:hypothetical protein